MRYVLDLDETLRELDRKVKQLRLDYERYFLGTRPREPVMLRADVDKLVTIFSNTAIQNTALRFRLNSIVSRYQALKRQWIDILRKIEAGTYERHRFKADLHQREREREQEPRPSGGAAEPGDAPDLFSDYRDARLACGQAVKSLTPQKLESMLDKQRAKLKERFGDTEFRFRVVVEDGKAKVKASKVRS